MTTAVLLDHVSAYAAAVRSHLSDLTPEQVEDLTDGLEADLAEALEDPHGVVATGDLPLGDPGALLGSQAADAGEASMIDLTRRFGPAAEYAAELRAAAGLEAPTATKRGLREAVRGIGGELRGRLATAAAPVTGSRAWPAVVGVLVALRPVWWVLRGWVWFVATAGLFRPVVAVTQHQVYLPETFLGWVWFGAAVLLSVQYGRGLLRGARWGRRVLRVASVVTAIVVVPLMAAFLGYLQNQLAVGRSYVEVPVYLDHPAAVVENGVFVDGMQVSNLFVYDAEGNPLTGVQIYDDRGRQVRTVEDVWAQWSLPGVEEPWSFGPVHDADGRVRWNVYPLVGAPFDEWTQEDEGRRVLGDGAEPQTPPRPFAMAPAVEVPPEPDGSEDVTPGATPQRSATDDAVAGADGGAAVEGATPGDAAAAEAAAPETAVPDTDAPAGGA